MSKTHLSTYLTTHQVAELRRLGALHERTVCSLIREGVDMVLEDLGGVVETEDAESRGSRDRAYATDARKRKTA